MTTQFFGLEGKGESTAIKQLNSVLFEHAKNEFEAISVCGIQPGCRRKREIDLLMLIAYNDNSGERLKRTTKDIKEGLCIRTKSNEYEYRDALRNQKYYLRNIGLTIDVKEHSGNNIDVKGGDLFVKYTEWENVNSKFIEQAKTCRDYIEAKTKQRIYNFNTFVYLPNVRKQDLMHKVKDRPELQNTIIYVDTTLDEVLDMCIYQEKLFRFEERSWYSLGNADFDFEEAGRSLTKYFKSFHPGKLEMEKLEIIARDYIDMDNKQWTNKHLGERMIIFSGVAGTGKTLRLLRTSNQLMRDFDQPTLFLTFNRALRGDLERLMQLQRIRGGSRITVWTIDSFMYKLVKLLGLCDSYEDYKEQKKDKDIFSLRRKLVLESLKNQELHSQAQEMVREFTYVAIDEGQDWYPEERDIILDLFNVNNILVASGNDQCIRSPILANWEKDAIQKGGDSKKLHGQKSLRQLSCLNKFNNLLADNLNIGWKQSINKKLVGGEIILFEHFESIANHFLSELALDESKYSPIDYLVMCPPADADQVLGTIKALDIEIWDGVTDEDRDVIPRSDQIRCVSTQSCRGLEGWATVLFDIDKWLWFCIEKERSRIRGEEAPTLFEMESIQKDLDMNDLQFLPTWFLIPFTRAKSRMYIQLPRSSAIRKVFLQLQKENQDFVRVMQ